MEQLIVQELSNKVQSLEADTMLIMSCLSHSFTNEQILRRFEAWSFSEIKIERALVKLCRTFGLENLDNEDEKRRRMGELYDQHRTFLGYPKKLRLNVRVTRKKKWNHIVRN